MDSHNPCICRSKGALERRHIDDRYLEQHRQAEARDDPSLRQQLEAILNLGMLVQTEFEEVVERPHGGAQRRCDARLVAPWMCGRYHRAHIAERLESGHQRGLGRCHPKASQAIQEEDARASLPYLRPCVACRRPACPTGSRLSSQPFPIVTLPTTQTPERARACMLHPCFQALPRTSIG